MAQIMRFNEVLIIQSHKNRVSGCSFAQRKKNVFLITFGKPCDGNTYPLCFSVICESALRD